MDRHTRTSVPDIYVAGDCAETWHRIFQRVTGGRWTGRVLGAQIVGPWQAEVAKRIDIYDAALLHEMSVDAISDLDLSYTPPFGSPWDTVQIAAQAWERSRAKG